MDEALVDLQVKYAYQEDMLRELSDALYAQQRQIDELLKRLGSLERLVHGGEGAS